MFKKPRPIVRPILIAICLIPVPLRPQEHSLPTRTSANSQSSSEVTLGEKLAREYEKQAGLGSTPELDGIPRYMNSVGSKVASVLPSGRQYHFVFDPNPDFKSAFALPGGYITSHIRTSIVRMLIPWQQRQDGTLQRVALRPSLFGMLFWPDKSWNKVLRIWFTYLSTKRAGKEDRVLARGNPWPCVR
jgi:hypothetical protein